MSLGRNDKEDTMSNPVRKKLNELKELRQENPHEWSNHVGTVSAKDSVKVHWR